MNGDWWKYPSAPPLGGASTSHHSWREYLRAWQPMSELRAAWRAAGCCQLEDEGRSRLSVVVRIRSNLGTVHLESWIVVFIWRPVDASRVGECRARVCVWLPRVWILVVAVFGPPLRRVLDKTALREERAATLRLHDHTIDAAVSGTRTR